MTESGQDGADGAGGTPDDRELVVSVPPVLVAVLRQRLTARRRTRFCTPRYRNRAGSHTWAMMISGCDPVRRERVVLLLRIRGTGAITATKAAPYLKQSVAGSTISLSLLGGRFTYVKRSPYAVTKRGIIALTEMLSVELGSDNTRVNVIAPGATGRFKASPAHDWMCN